MYYSNCHRYRFYCINVLSMRKKSLGKQHTIQHLHTFFLSNSSVVYYNTSKYKARRKYFTHTVSQLENASFQNECGRKGADH